MASGAPCLDENEALAFLKGQLSPELSLDAQQHLATCSSCQDLLALILEHSFLDPRASTLETRTEPAGAGISQADTTPAAEEPRTTLIGQRVGNYVVTGFFGKGGMGEVYLATHPQIGRQVAVKVLSATSPELTGRFLREARVLARLRHPNVVEIYDFGQLEQGQLYYTMEPLWGRSLDEVARQSAPLSVDAAAPYLEQICAGLQAAHEAGVVHRDLKPGNVVVLQASPLQLKLVDFGLARTEAEDEDDAHTTSPGLVLGTPHYLAPEQALGQHERVSARTDLYALGVLLHLLLSGRAPFSGTTPAAVVAAQIEAAPPRLEGVPDAVAEVVLRCLAKDPDDRPASASAVSAAFVAALQPAAQAAGVARRWALLAFGALALLAVILVVTLRAPGGRADPADVPPTIQGLGAAAEAESDGPVRRAPVLSAPVLSGPVRRAPAHSGRAPGDAAPLTVPTRLAPRPPLRPRRPAAAPAPARDAAAPRKPRRVGEGTLPF